MTTTILTAEDVRSAISMPEAITAVRQAFLDLDAGAFEQPTRLALRDGRFLVMAAHHKPTASAAVKTLSLNFQRSPAITGNIVWTDTVSSDMIVADAGSVTVLRTGAIVGVATDLLARPDAERMVLIGAGGQAAGQVRAVQAVRPLTRLTVVDADPAKADLLLQAMSDELGDVEATISSDIAGAVSEADIVCCATSATSPLFSVDMLPKQVHVNAIGAYRPTMTELPPELLRDASVVVDERIPILVESGEILNAIAAGMLQEGDLVELGSALRTGLPSANERTVFKTVGIAAQDWAIMHALASKRRSAQAPTAVSHSP